MTKQYEILPCPLCDGEAHLNFYTIPCLCVQVSCDECDNSTPVICADTSYCAEVEAIKVWNQSAKSTLVRCECGTMPKIICEVERDAVYMSATCPECGCSESITCDSSSPLDVENVKWRTTIAWNGRRRREEMELLKELKEPKRRTEI